jgi:hypothetical protein
MLSKSALSASDRKKWGRQAVGVGQHRVLLALWDHAHGWRTGSGDWFVWPAVGTIATVFGLTDDAVRRCLRELTARGWIRPDVNDGRRGWWLRETPTVDPPQLELFASVPSEPAAVDNLGMAPDNHRAERDGCTDNHRATSSIGTGRTVGTAREHDDAVRIWSLYEEFRVRLLGGTMRDGPPPASLRALITSHGAADVEAYARRAVELAASAVARGRSSAADRVAERSDGREWHPTRFAAVLAWREPDVPAAVTLRRGPPLPAPAVDGERVTLHEGEAYERGGEEGVREHRRELARTNDTGAGVAHIEGWLRKIGGRG